MRTDAKTLYLDFEIGPAFGVSYQKYETTLNDVTQYPWIQCVAWKWSNEDKVHVLGQDDFPKKWRADRFDDSGIVEATINEVKKADIVVAHNAKKFDIKWLRTRALLNDFDSLGKLKVLDTLQIARSRYNFFGNSLNDLAIQLGVGKKLDKGYKDLWKLCLNGDEKAWKAMKEYNKHDVVLLEKIYLKFLPDIEVFPVVRPENGKCRKCGSSNCQKRGFGYTKTGRYQKYQCVGCGSWSHDKPEKLEWSISN